MPNRFNAYNESLYSFIANIFVVCPSCSKQALVKTTGKLREDNEKEIKLICSGCGMNKYYAEKPQTNLTLSGSSKVYKIRHYIMGSNVDPFFHLPLWIQKEMPDGLLWAYNYEHLEFLKNHISAELRERDINDIRNKSLGARLPKWMTSKKNRQAVLAAIEKLKQ